ncbi:MAG: 50S ribosomal protein L2 [Candidatus Nealsonbacteria bacterium RIFCSPLOWO2_01_FULL_41_9]|uniref:Large ribosomal subunit protein uL2 n=1 Tax=Candidatus Nealsonbacteria bacterium RIFCSPLOWO2_01_FULL_41_9 TaxID=1801671 RepID=A0A1G2E9R8_9BACT|nr:MAG: 50S ribosomal protein L2 [Candidatus Nealsonbacteria bacterium RIFCSPLOWO2_01_FULL_41_9]
MGKSILSKKGPEKKLLVSLKRWAGRNSSGRITVRHRGGGVKRFYRIVEFGQDKLNVKAKIISLEYDPYRSAFIALVEYPDKDRKYILAPKDLKAGDEIIFAENAEIKPGNRAKLKNIPVGTMVFNIELTPGRGGQLAKGAGTMAKVLGGEGKFVQVELPSKETRLIQGECFATIGQVSHQEHRFEQAGKAGLRKAGKAGSKRRKGWRPSVRGNAMNPPDHPHGGGEGRTPIGMPYPMTPWGKPARGVRTRKKRKWTDKFIIKRRK